MKAGLWQAFKKVVHKKLIRLAIGDAVACETYSQMGEDRILRELLAHKVDSGKRGFFVDIGAYHPVKYSNTYWFYKRGWSGINVDARPGTKRLFDEFRPRDINVEYAVTDREGVAEFLVLADASTINRLATHEERESGRLIAQHGVAVAGMTLSALLEKHLPAGQHIDFLSIDIEGEDEAVVLSTDWWRVRPDYLLVEQSWTTIEEMLQCNVVQALHASGYFLFDLCRGYWPPAPKVVRARPSTLFFVSREMVN